MSQIFINKVLVDSCCISQGLKRKLKEHGFCWVFWSDEYHLKQPNKIETLCEYQLVHKNNPMIWIMDPWVKKYLG